MKCCNDFIKGLFDFPHPKCQWKRRKEFHLAPINGCGGRFVDSTNLCSLRRSWPRSDRVATSTSPASRGNTRCRCCRRRKSPSAADISTSGKGCIPPPRWHRHRPLCWPSRLRKINKQTQLSETQFQEQWMKQDSDREMDSWVEKTVIRKTNKKNTGSEFFSRL